MIYKELLEKLNKLTQSQLEQHVTFINDNNMTNNLALLDVELHISEEDIAGDNIIIPKGTVTMAAE